MDKEQLIQQYIAKNLSNTDIEIVETLLETDADFKLAYDSHKDITMASKLSEAQSLKEKFQKLEQDSTEDGRNKYRKSKLWYPAIASVLIIGFFYAINSGTNGEDLFNSNFSVYPNTHQPVIRSTSENINLAAFVAYENGDFERAELEFEDLLKKEENPNLQFYYALSLLNQSKFDLSLAQLEQLEKNSTNYEAETYWYAALIYLQKEDFKNAKIKLESLNTLNSTFKSQERKLLFQELTDLL